MKTISKVNLLLAIVSVCIGTAMLVLSTVTAVKFARKKREKETI